MSRKMGWGGYESPFHAVRLTSSVLYAGGVVRGAGAAAQVADAGSGNYRGISIAPDSAYRAIACYFDDSSEAVPLVAGQPIALQFRRVRVSPLASWVQAPGNLAVTGIALTPPLYPGALRLRLWKEAPPEYEQIPRTVEIAQTTLSLDGGTFVAPGVIMAAHAPGAKSVTLWASNQNTANSAVVGVTLYGSRSAVGDGDALLTVPKSSGALSGQILVPASADAFGAISAGVGDPGELEYQIQITANSASAVVKVGLIFTFDR